MPSERGSRLRLLWRELRFRDALLITFLPLVAALVMVADSLLGYYRARQFDDWWSRGFTVAGVFETRVGALYRLPQRLLIRQRLDPDTRDAATLRLNFPRELWDSVHADPQAMWGEWVRGGELRYGATATNARLRKRGDNSIHWLHDKRSFTVRTSLEEFYKRYRTFGLSMRDVLPAYVANRLAREFGLLAPETTVVPVFLNNAYYGMFRFIEPVDEAFLRRVGRLPGNIYQGDRAERGDVMKGAPRPLFENPFLWEREDTVPLRNPAAPDPLPPLLRDLHGVEYADHQRVLARFDPEEYARLFAYLFFAGDPFHMDELHNHFLYEDPSTGLLHPVAWDTRLLDWSRPERLRVNTLYRALLDNPFIVEATARQIAGHLRSNAIARAADSLARAAEQRFADEFTYDRLREGLVPDVGSAARAAALVAGNARVLQRWIDSSVVAVHATPGPTAIIDAETRGYTGADLVALRLDRPAAGAVVLRLDRNLNGVLDATDPAVALQPAGGSESTRLLPAVPVPFHAGWNTRAGAIQPGRFAYRFFVVGLPAGAVPALELANRVTAAPATIVAWPPDSFIEASTGFHPWLFTEPAGRRITWSGGVRLAGTVRIGPRDTLSIAPGTTLTLGPGVSVISQGLVWARGTAALPIRVLPADSGKPWGAFSLQGHGADGSIIEHAEFVSGSRTLDGGVQYLGTLNVHQADRVRFERVLLRDNRQSEQALHVVLARDVEIRDSRFLRTGAAAIELQLSSGIIAGNSIEQSRRNGIELATSSPRIIGNRIRASGDQGISIGEASRPLIFNNLIEGSGTGIEVRDGSEPVILHNEITGNGVGLTQGPRYWHYSSGGWATVVQTLFRDNQAVRGRDSVSRLTSLGSTGLDSKMAEHAPPRMDWLYAQFGIAGGARRPGRLPEWSPLPPVPPLFGGRFEDDFGSLSDRWVPFGGTTRLEKRRGVLILETEGSPGGMALPVGLELAGPGVLVIEVAGRDMARAELTVSGDHEVRVSFDPGADLDRFRFVELTLPAGRYREIRVTATPAPGVSHIQRTTGLSILRAGRLDLRSYAVYPTAP